MLKFKKKSTQWVKNSLLSIEMQGKYLDLMEERYGRIEG
ncbi:hypothetical protein A33Q_0601 [Indibacter alkaliphilus LW1]|uniref:Uncharacterized protein n=1 Tax=Indibacter alkaliphilus (strain CCUG 57479 / KCTC 22604 / LW1) TaxID=1189612 RepID=S2EA57_INDAL|nr:hypothetical protein A33Q_0601 [Indibacter alkaliphilus LW1]